MFIHLSLFSVLAIVEPIVADPTEPQASESWDQPAPPPRCEADNDCSSDHICDAGTCRAPSAPLGGCTSDVQCKGLRICSEGTCEDPPPATSQPSTPAPPPVVPPRPLHDGWALAGGIVGLTFGAIGLGLAIGSEITRGEQIPALPLGGAATALFVVAVPVAAGGAQSARRGAEVRGSVAAAICGWILYGVTITEALTLIGLGVAEIEPPAGLIASAGVLGLGASASMAAHAFTAHAQARRKLSAGRPGELRIASVPTVSSEGVTGMVIGVGGRF